jgi:hypothetical protein
MLYTIAGFFLGAFAGCVICAITNQDTRNGPYAPSSGTLTITATSILGAGIGFGIGVSRLANGNYFSF